MTEIALVKNRCSPAEKLPVGSAMVDLISVGTAAHWFDLPAFFKEVI